MPFKTMPAVGAAETMVRLYSPLSLGQTLFGVIVSKSSALLRMQVPCCWLP